MNDISYIVETADFEFEDIVDNGAVIIKPTSEIDSRTIKIKSFSNQTDALEFAEKVFKERKENDDEMRWLAYLRVCKCVKETIKEFK